MFAKPTEVLRQYLDSTPKLDADATLALFAADATVTTPLMPNAKPMQGKATFERAFRAVYSHFKRFAWEDIHLNATDDPELAVARCSATAVLSNGQNYQNDYSIFVRVRDGKVIELTEYFSPIKAAMVSQSAPAVSR